MYAEEEELQRSVFRMVPSSCVAVQVCIVYFFLLRARDVRSRYELITSEDWVVFAIECRRLYGTNIKIVDTSNYYHIILIQMLIIIKFLLFTINYV